MDDTVYDVLTNGHAGMLHDTQRHQAYKSAIHDAIKKIHESGDIVTLLDIGYGTGLLTMYAAEAGAETVVACESDETMAEIGKKIVLSNQLRFKKPCNFKFETASSSMLDKLNPNYKNCFNVIVSEIYDSELIGEGCLTTYRHALMNLATKNCIFIPSQATLFAQSVFSPILSSYSYLEEISCRKLKKVHLELQSSWEVHVDRIKDIELGEIIKICHFDFNLSSINDWSGKWIVDIHNNKMSHGVLVWWKSEMGSSNFITTAPSSNAEYQGFRDHWMPLFYSLCPQSIDKLSFEVEINDMEVHVRHPVDLNCFCKGNRPKFIELSLHRYVGMTNCSKLRNAYMKCIHNVEDPRKTAQKYKKFVHIGLNSFVKYLIPDANIRNKIKEIDNVVLDDIRDSVIIDSCIHPQCLTTVSHFYRRKQLERSIGTNCILIPNDVVLMVSLVECYQLRNKNIVPSEIDGFDLSHYSSKVKECLEACRAQDMFEPIHLWEYDYVLLSSPSQLKNFENTDCAIRKILPVHQSGTVTNVILSLAFYFDGECLEFDNTDYFNKVDCFTPVNCLDVENGDKVGVIFTLINGEIDKIELEKL